MSRDDWLWLLGGVVLILAIGFGLMTVWSTPVQAAACHGRVGMASWYGQESGRRTANGEFFDGSGMTAATLDQPFGARLRVTDLHTGRSIVVRANDRGPYIKGRIIDLARAAARRLGMGGVAKVCVERLR